jgi:hypothetical protein
MIALVFSFCFYFLEKFDFFVYKFYICLKELLHLLAGSATGIGTSARAVGSGAVGTLAILTGTSTASVLRAEIYEGIYPGLAISHPYTFFFVSSFFAIFAYNLKMTSDRIAGDGDAKALA